jgi:hypothetical protein
LPPAEELGSAIKFKSLQCLIVGKKLINVSKLGVAELPFRRGERHDLTRLTLRLDGYDSATKKIVDAGGALVLATDDGVIAASWSFTSLATLWNRKHAQAVYVPAECRTDPVREYRYGSRVRLGEGTDFLRLLSAIDAHKVYYDPGIRLEAASTAKPQTKRRSQFRIKSSNLPALYATMTDVEVA